MDGAVDEGRLLTTVQVARRLGVHPNTVRKWDDDGLLPAAGRLPTGARRFRAGDVAAMRRRMGLDLAPAAGGETRPAD